jgi:hypothetical protein
VLKLLTGLNYPTYHTDVLTAFVEDLGLNSFGNLTALLAERVVVRVVVYVMVAGFYIAT